MKLISSPAILLILTSLASAQATPYSIGEPTNDEQYYLELINRARANPTAEGNLLAATTDPLARIAITQFGVNLNLFKTEMTAIPVRPPLAMNPTLVTVARAHSLDMFNMGLQSHIGSNGSTSSQRGTTAGYSGILMLENIYASSDSTAFGHTAFEIDWGTGSTGGMQPGRPHRFSIHHHEIKEVGVGIFMGSKVVGTISLGPQFVTQDFGTGTASTAFVTGVVYHDLNGNKFYDPGEGVGGVRVDLNNGAYVGITAGSGGYTVPVPSTNATYSMKFTGPGILSLKSAVVTGGANVKVDLALGYQAPVVTGTSAPAVGIPTVYTVSPVLGATSYDWKLAVESPAQNDNAEDLNRVTTTGTPSHPMINSNVKFQGSKSYHLFHEASPPTRDRALTYNEVFQVGTGAAISFYSRLGLVSLDQTAKFQVSVDGGASWTLLWSQSGTNTLGESAFQLRSVPLTAYAGKAIRLRFQFSFPEGGLIFDPASYPTFATGWFVDQIVFTNVKAISTGVISSAGADGTFEFMASSATQSVLSARPVFPGRTDSFGPSKLVTASTQNTYATWAIAQEAAFGLAAGSLSSNREGDSNGDGVANIMAYALGLDPMTNVGQRLPKPQQNADQIYLDYTTYTTRTDLNWGPEAATTLGNWVAPGKPATPMGFVDQVMSTEGTTVHRRATLPLGRQSSAFIRMKAVLK